MPSDLGCKITHFSDYRWRVIGLIMSCYLRYEASCCVRHSYWVTLRNKCPYSVFPVSVFFRIPSEYGYFHIFGLNTEIYTVNLHIQSEYGKIRTRKIPNTNIFHAVWNMQDDKTSDTYNKHVIISREAITWSVPINTCSEKFYLVVSKVQSNTYSPAVFYKRQF